MPKTNRNCCQSYQSNNLRFPLLLCTQIAYRSTEQCLCQPLKTVRLQPQINDLKIWKNMKGVHWCPLKKPFVETYTPLYFVLEYYKKVTLCNWLILTGCVAVDSTLIIVISLVVAGIILVKAISVIVKKLKRRKKKRRTEVLMDI